MRTLSAGPLPFGSGTRETTAPGIVAKAAARIPDMAASPASCVLPEFWLHQEIRSSVSTAFCWERPCMDGGIMAAA